MVSKPGLETILMVEKALMDADNYPKRMELWRSLPRKVHYSTFKMALDYLEAQGRIAFNSNTIIYTGVNNDKLRKLIDENVRI